MAKEAQKIFYEDEKALIERKISQRNTSLFWHLFSESISFEDFYDLDQTVSFIKENAFEKIALQFPDEMLCDASKLSSLLHQRTGKPNFILADTSYGSKIFDFHSFLY